MLKEAGIKVHRFRSGPLKATGDPDFALTREEKAYLTEKTTYMANTFYNIVSDARGLPLAAMEKLGITSGRTFIGEQAKAAMLIDEVKTFDQSILKAYDLAKKYLDKSVNRGIGYRH
jgi:ClpP class serine protease